MAKKAVAKTAQKKAAAPKKAVSNVDSRVELIRKEMEAKYGLNAVRPASELTEERVYRIPTGSLGLDIDTGGGIPVGRMTHIVGDYSSGKSAVLYHACGFAQKMRKIEVPWDVVRERTGKDYMRQIMLKDSDEGEPLLTGIIQFESHSYTNDWGEKCGLDISQLIFSEPDGLEEGVDIAVEWQRKYGVEVIGIDSYAAASPTLNLEHDADSDKEARMGVKQKCLSEYHGKFQAANNRASREGRIPTTLIVLNQIREKIGARVRPGLPIPTYSVGGKSKDYTACLEIHLKKGEPLYVGSGDNKVQIGVQMKWKITKNKTAPAYRIGSVDFYFEEGGPVPAGCFDTVKEVGLLSVAYGVVERRGSHFYYKGEHLAGKADDFYAVLRERPELVEELYQVTLETALELIKEEPMINTESDSSEVDEFEVEAKELEERVGEVVEPVDTPTTKKKLLRKSK